MEKIKIGIDLDKTIFDCKSILYTLFNCFHWNKNKKLKHHEVSQAVPCKKSLANRLFRMLNPNFYFTFPDAVQTINKLTEMGFEVHLVSNRPNIRPVVALTLMSLQNHGLKYDKLVLGCNNKQEYAKREGLDFFVDNVEQICQSFEQTTSVKAIYFKAEKKEIKKAENIPFSSKRDKKILKSEEQRDLVCHRFKEISSWGGIGEFLLEEKNKRNNLNAIREHFIKNHSNNFISKGLCLPAPTKTK